MTLSALKWAVLQRLPERRAAAAVFVLAVVVYVRNLTGEECYDDGLVLGNPVVVGTAPLRDAWTTDYWCAPPPRRRGRLAAAAAADHVAAAAVPASAARVAAGCCCRRAALAAPLSVALPPRRAPSYPLGS